MEPHVILDTDHQGISERTKLTASKLSSDPLDPNMLNPLPNRNKRLQEFIGVSIISPILLFIVVAIFYGVSDNYRTCGSNATCVILHLYPWIDILITSGCLVAVFRATGTISVSIFVMQVIVGILTTAASITIVVFYFVEGGKLVREGTVNKGPDGCYDSCGIYVLVGLAYILPIVLVYLPLFGTMCWVRIVAIYNSYVLRRS